MAEAESAHGKLTPIDKQFNNKVFMALLVGTMTVALIIIYVIASHPFGETDFGWYPFAHDPIKHVVEHSTF